MGQVWHLRQTTWHPVLGKRYYDENVFFRALYDKCKSKIAAWSDHDMCTQFGRSMLANAMIYSRFRYQAQCMALPKWLNEAIESDVQALVWSKQIEFDAEEEGTEASFK